MKYRKRPVVIDALRWGYDEPEDWFIDAIKYGAIKEVYTDGEAILLIETLEGIAVAVNGAWVLRGVENELYPCKHSIFEATYELAEPVS